MKLITKFIVCKKKLKRKLSIYNCPLYHINYNSKIYRNMYIIFVPYSKNQNIIIKSSKASKGCYLFLSEYVSFICVLLLFVKDRWRHFKILLLMIMMSCSLNLEQKNVPKEIIGYLELKKCSYDLLVKEIDQNLLMLH